MRYFAAAEEDVKNQTSMTKEIIELRVDSNIFNNFNLKFISHVTKIYAIQKL